jgi:hypothetical protein
MEILVPIAIGAVGIGVVLFALRRQTVVATPPANPSNAPGVVVAKGKRVVRWTIREVNQAGGLAGDPPLTSMRMETGNKLLNDLWKFVPDPAPIGVPQALLQFPGSTIVLKSIEGASQSGGRMTSTYKVTFATEADRDQLLAWYQDQLTSHGWQPAQLTSPSDGTAVTYSRGEETFRLSTADAAAVRTVIAVPIPDTARTVFEIDYLAAGPQAPRLNG